MEVWNQGCKISSSHTSDSISTCGHSEERPKYETQTRSILDVCLNINIIHAGL
jgi:hypothetical protein